MSIEIGEPDFNRVVIVHPPWNSEVADAARERLTGWLGNDITATTLETTSGEVEPNAALFHNKLEEGDAVALVSGDGTFNLFMRAMFSQPELQERLKSISVTSLNQGGNACDIGTSLHGRFQKDPQAIFSRDRLRAVSAYTLSTTITPEAQESVADEARKTTKHLAVSYIGMGKTAEATSRLTEEWYRKGNRIIRDARIVAGTLANGSSFEIISDRGYQGSFSELTIANGPNMAKWAHFPVELWQPRYRLTTVPKGRLATAYAASMLLVGAARGINAIEPTRLMTETAVAMHFDGEPPINVPAQSEVIVGLGKTFTALTTRKI